MSGRIRRCTEDHLYTLYQTCPKCGGATSIAHPARFSPEDRYGLYRRNSKV